MKVEDRRKATDTAVEIAGNRNEKLQKGRRSSSVVNYVENSKFIKVFILL